MCQSSILQHSETLAHCNRRGQDDSISMQTTTKCVRGEDIKNSMKQNLMTTIPNWPSVPPFQNKRCASGWEQKTTGQRGFGLSALPKCEQGSTELCEITAVNITHRQAPQNVGKENNRPPHWRRPLLLTIWKAPVTDGLRQSSSCSSAKTDGSCSLRDRRAPSICVCVWVCVWGGHLWATTYRLLSYLSRENWKRKLC